jgi:Mycothiol maleylpyruvate isomerase N-terminal domain
MTLHFTGVLDRSSVIDAADLVADLVARPEVAVAWTRESSCAGMSVGGLTRHLVSQPVNTVTLLRADRGEGAGAETIDLLEHYARASWLREDLDGEANVSIRAVADQQASEGPAAAAVLLSNARSELEAELADAPPTTYVPWQGWSLATDDFLVTRLMEMVVHADDLAASVDVSTPDFGPTVLDPVFRLLTALAVRRHGHDALVRTLARPQRAPASVSAF